MYNPQKLVSQNRVLLSDTLCGQVTGFYTRPATATSRVAQISGFGHMIFTKSRLKQEELQGWQSGALIFCLQTVWMQLGAFHLTDQSSYSENAAAAVMVNAMGAFQATSPCQGFDVLYIITLRFL